MSGATARFSRPGSCVVARLDHHLPRHRSRDLPPLYVHPELFLHVESAALFRRARGFLNVRHWSRSSPNRRAPSAWWHSPSMTVFLQRGSERGARFFLPTAIECDRLLVAGTRGRTERLVDRSRPGRPRLRTHFRRRRSANWCPTGVEIGSHGFSHLPVPEGEGRATATAGLRSPGVHSNQLRGPRSGRSRTVRSGCRTSRGQRRLVEQGV